MDDEQAPSRGTTATALAAQSIDATVDPGSYPTPYGTAGVEPQYDDPRVRRAGGRSRRRQAVCRAVGHAYRADHGTTRNKSAVMKTVGLFPQVGALRPKTVRGPAQGPPRPRDHERLTLPTGVTTPVTCTIDECRR